MVPSATWFLLAIPRRMVAKFSALSVFRSAAPQFCSNVSRPSITSRPVQRFGSQLETGINRWRANVLEWQLAGAHIEIEAPTRIPQSLYSWRSLYMR